MVGMMKLEAPISLDRVASTRIVGSSVFIIFPLDHNTQKFAGKNKIVPIGDWGHLLTLTLTSDDLEGHIVVNVSSTSNNSTIWFVAALSLIVDVRTDVRMGRHFYRVY